MSAIQIPCPSCGQKLSFEAEALRKRMACPRCANSFIPIDSLPRDQALPAISVAEAPEINAPEKAPTVPPARIVKTVLLMPNEAASPPAAGATPAPKTPPPAEAPPVTPPAPARGALPPLAVTPVLDNARTVIKAPTPKATPAPVEEAPPTAATESKDVAAPTPEDTKAPLDTPDAAPEVAEAPVAAEPPAAEQPTEAAAAPTNPEASTGKAAIPPLREILPEITDLVARSPLGSRETKGILRIALIAVGVALLALILLALASGSVFRFMDGLVATVALATALLAGGVILLLRSRKETENAEPKAPSTHAKQFAMAGSGVALLLAIGITSIVAAATGGSNTALRLNHFAMPKLPAKPDLPPELRADYKFKRDGHVLVMGGLLHVPTGFRSDDGSFDLYMHFHGNPTVVKESANEVSLNALVYTVNLGNGSGPYEEKYSVAGVFEQTITKIQETARTRGLKDAKVRRIALGSWSAGYGALSRLLNVDANVERVDSVLVMDGIHAAYLDPKAKTVDPVRLSPFLRFAKLAGEGKRMFSISHSELGGMTYASTHETADALLREVGAERAAANQTPPRVTTPALLAALPKPQEAWLEQTTEANTGAMHVRGYSGQTPDQHMAHLVQMSVTVLPDLVERWR